MIVRTFRTFSIQNIQHSVKLSSNNLDGRISVSSSKFTILSLFCTNPLFIVLTIWEAMKVCVCASLRHLWLFQIANFPNDANAKQASSLQLTLAALTHCGPKPPATSASFASLDNSRLAFITFLHANCKYPWSLDNLQALQCAGDDHGRSCSCQLLILKTAPQQSIRSPFATILRWSLVTIAISFEAEFMAFLFCYFSLHYSFLLDYLKMRVIFTQ